MFSACNFLAIMFCSLLCNFKIYSINIRKCSIYCIICALVCFGKGSKILNTFLSMFSAYNAYENRLLLHSDLDLHCLFRVYF